MENSSQETLSLVKNVTSIKCNYDIDPSESFTVSIISTVILTIILVIGIVGNGMILYIIISGRDTKTKTYKFVANLAISNFGMALFCITLRLGAFIGASKPSKVLCQIDMSVNVFWLSLSVYSVTAVALYKYFSVVHPLRRILTRIRVYIFLSLIWALALLCSLVVQINRDKLFFKKSIFHCSFAPAESARDLYPGLFLLFAVFAVPLVLNVYIFGRILKAVKTHTRRMSKTAIMDDAEIRAHRRAILTIITLFVLYLLSWIPFFLHEILFLLGLSHCTYAKRLLQCAYLIGFSTSAQNPIVLCSRNARLKEGVWSIVNRLRNKLHLPGAVNREAPSKTPCSLSLGPEAGLNGHCARWSPAVDNPAFELHCVNDETLSRPTAVTLCRRVSDL